MQLTRWCNLFLLTGTILAFERSARVGNVAVLKARHPAPAPESELADIHARDPYETVSNLVNQRRWELQTRAMTKQNGALVARDEITITCPKCKERMHATTRISHGVRCCDCAHCGAYLVRQPDGTWVHRKQTVYDSSSSSSSSTSSL